MCYRINYHVASVCSVWTKSPADAGIVQSFEEEVSRMSSIEVIEAPAFAAPVQPVQPVQPLVVPEPMAPIAEETDDWEMGFDEEEDEFGFDVEGEDDKEPEVQEEPAETEAPTPPEAPDEAGDEALKEDEETVPGETETGAEAIEPESETEATVTPEGADEVVPVEPGAMEPVAEELVVSEAAVEGEPVVAVEPAPGEVPVETTEPAELPVVPETPAIPEVPQPPIPTSVEELERSPDMSEKETKKWLKGKQKELAKKVKKLKKEGLTEEVATSRALAEMAGIPETPAAVPEPVTLPTPAVPIPTSVEELERPPDMSEKETKKWVTGKQKELVKKVKKLKKEGLTEEEATSRTLAEMAGIPETPAVVPEPAVQPAAEAPEAPEEEATPETVSSEAITPVVEEREVAPDEPAVAVTEETEAPAIEAPTIEVEGADTAETAEVPQKAGLEDDEAVAPVTPEALEEVPVEPETVIPVPVQEPPAPVVPTSVEELERPSDLSDKETKKWLKGKQKELAKKVKKLKKEGLTEEEATSKTLAEMAGIPETQAAVPEPVPVEEPATEVVEAPAEEVVVEEAEPEHTDGEEAIVTPAEPEVVEDDDWGEDGGAEEPETAPTEVAETVEPEVKADIPPPEEAQAVEDEPVEDGTARVVEAPKDTPVVIEEEAPVEAPIEEATAVEVAPAADEPIPATVEPEEATAAVVEEAPPEDQVEPETEAAGTADDVLLAGISAAVAGVVPAAHSMDLSLEEAVVSATEKEPEPPVEDPQIPKLEPELVPEIIPIDEIPEVEAKRPETSETPEATAQEAIEERPLDLPVEIVAEEGEAAQEVAVDELTVDRVVPVEHDAPAPAKETAAQETLAPWDMEGPDEELYPVGSRVTHKLFGTGTVIDRQPKKKLWKLNVEFEGPAGSKDVLSNFVEPLVEAAESALETVDEVMAGESLLPKPVAPIIEPVVPVAATPKVVPAVVPAVIPIEEPVKALAPDPNLYQVSTRITHKVFGTGTIIARQPQQQHWRLTIDFDEQEGSRDILSRFVSPIAEVTEAVTTAVKGIAEGIDGIVARVTPSEMAVVAPVEEPVKVVDDAPGSGIKTPEVVVAEPDIDPEPPVPETIDTSDEEVEFVEEPDQEVEPAAIPEPEEAPAKVKPPEETVEEAPPEIVVPTEPKVEPAVVEPPVAPIPVVSEADVVNDPVATQWARPAKVTAAPVEPAVVEPVVAVTPVDPLEVAAVDEQLPEMAQAVVVALDDFDDSEIIEATAVETVQVAEDVEVLEELDTRKRE